ncbi:MAG TPA: hypothetical protein VGJ84_23550, partial [Polyangiaceae bacterium]
MADARLTRQELSWLLAQEAHTAAKSLREGVTQRKLSPAETLPESGPSIELTLDVLDDAIGVLSALQSEPQSSARRGRIDLAALLCAIAPNARIAIEPGAGTEVLGEEAELRRMVHVLVHQTNSDPAAVGASASSEVTIRREGDWVRISVGLGPDTAATAEVERRWLSRMATRLGGRFELEGGMQSVVLPADGASDRREVAELRKELHQAQRLGEAYARELAAAFSATEQAAPTVAERGSQFGTDGFGLLVSAASALSRTLREWLESLRSDMLLVVKELGDGSALAQSLERHYTFGIELLLELKRLAECPADEKPTEVNLAEIANQVAAELGPRLSRHSLSLKLELATSGVLNAPRATLELLLRALAEHAISATPRDGTVVLRARDQADGIWIGVEDGGTTVPASARGDLIEHRVDPTSLGRPSGPSLLVASAAAAKLGGALTFGESS